MTFTDLSRTPAQHGPKPKAGNLECRRTSQEVWFNEERDGICILKRPGFCLAPHGAY